MNNDENIKDQASEQVNNENPNEEISEQTKHILYYNPRNSYCEILLPAKGHNVDGSAEISPMMYLGFSVEYDNTLRGNAVPCRIIGADVLDTTLRDFCNGADINSPIVVLMSDSNGKDCLHLYINGEKCYTPYLNIKYIKTPNTVNITNNIDCDLPEYCHYEIVERAVQKYKIAIGGQIADSRNNR